MRPNDSSKVWRKSGRGGREGSQPMTPRIRQAVTFAREMRCRYPYTWAPGWCHTHNARDGVS